MNRKVSKEDLDLILELVEHREKLRAEARELTNAKIAEKFGLGASTVDKYAALVTERARLERGRK